MPILERETILDGLDTLLGRAAWEGGRVVLVRGEAGIGKSTLVKAFADGRRDTVLWGMCDPVALPQPLGPIADMAAQRPGELDEALRSGDRHQVASAFLRLLRADGGPWVAVFEDVQWADEATLELLKFAARRIDRHPALIILTVRDEEAGPHHPLSLMLGDVPSSALVSVPLPPLSLSAVQELAAGSAVEPVALHAAAAGNPFFVTEVLASGGSDLPATIRDAVVARASRLPPESVEALQAAAVLGIRCEPDAVGRVSGMGSTALAECVARGMLRQEGTELEFTHELARRAILDSLSTARRAHLHGRALAVLSERPTRTDAAELANHALLAGDADAVLVWAPQAASRSAALGAHRAALMHYDAALPYVGRLDLAARAPLLAAQAFECYVADDLQRALASQAEAIACSQEIGDIEAEADGLASLALFQFWAGDVGAALATAEAAMARQREVEPGPGFARAAARLAQLLMMTGSYPDAIAWGERAVELAEQFGVDPVIVHALNTIGTSESCLGEDGGREKIEESLRRAYAADLEEDIARAYNNLLAEAAGNRRYDLYDRYAADALKFAADRDLDLTRRCLAGDMAEAAMERGRWDDACAQATFIIDRGWKSGRFQSLCVLGLVAARRGDDDAFRWLDAALAEANALAGGTLLCPMRAARAEAAWLVEDFRLAAQEVEAGFSVLSDDESAWVVGGISYWAWKLDPAFQPPSTVAEPYALLFAGHPRKAAAAWATIGCPYHEALALAESDDVDDLHRALTLMLGLGAVPAASKIAATLKEMGVRRIARGPRASTRTNPAGLSTREMEVLQLVAQGMRNAEIAERLVLSPKTVDHHVSSILAKLGARDRHEASRMAAELEVAT